MPHAPFGADQRRLRPALRVKEPRLPPADERLALAARTAGPLHTLASFLRTKRPPLNVELDGILARIQAAVAEYPSRINNPEPFYDAFLPGSTLLDGDDPLQSARRTRRSPSPRRRGARRIDRAHQHAVERIFDEFIALVGSLRLYLNEKNKDDILRKCYNLYIEGTSPVPATSFPEVDSPATSILASSNTVPNNVATIIGTNSNVNVATVPATPSLRRGNMNNSDSVGASPTPTNRSIQQPPDVAFAPTRNPSPATQHIVEGKSSASFPTTSNGGVVDPYPSAASDFSTNASTTVAHLDSRHPDTLTFPDVDDTATNKSADYATTVTFPSSTQSRGAGEGTYASSSSGLKPRVSHVETGQLTKPIPQPGFPKKPNQHHKRYMSHFNFGRNQTNESTATVVAHMESMPNSTLSTPVSAAALESTGTSGFPYMSTNLLGSKWQNIMKRKNMMLNASSKSHSADVASNIFSIAAGNGSNTITKDIVGKAIDSASNLAATIDDDEVRLYLIACITEMGLDELPKRSIGFCTINFFRMFLSSNDFRYVTSRAVRSVKRNVVQVYRELNAEINETGDARSSVVGVGSSRYSLTYHNAMLKASRNDLSALPSNGLVSVIERIDPESGAVTIITDPEKEASNRLSREKGKNGSRNSRRRSREENKGEQSKSTNGLAAPPSPTTDKGTQGSSSDSIFSGEEFYDAEQSLDTPTGVSTGASAKDKSPPMQQNIVNENNINGGPLQVVTRPSIPKITHTLHSPITEETDNLSSIADSAVERSESYSRQPRTQSNSGMPSRNASNSNLKEDGVLSTPRSRHMRSISHSGVMLSQSGSSHSLASPAVVISHPRRLSPGVEQALPPRVPLPARHSRRKSIMDNINKLIPGWTSKTDTQNGGLQPQASHSPFTPNSDISSRATPSTSNMGTENNMPTPGFGSNNSPELRKSTSVNSDISGLAQPDNRLEVCLRELQQDPRYLETTGSILCFIYQLWLIRLNSIVNYGKLSQSAANSLRVLGIDANGKLSEAFQHGKTDPLGPFYDSLVVLAERITNQDLGPLLDAWGRVRTKDMPILIASLRVIFLGNSFTEKQRGKGAKGKEDILAKGYQSKVDPNVFAGVDSARTALLRRNIFSGNDIFNDNEQTITYELITTAIDHIRALFKDQDNRDLFREVIKAVLGFWNDPLTVRICSHIKKLHVLAPFKAVLKLVRDFMTVFVPQLIESYKFISIPLEPVVVQGFEITFHDEIVIALENLLPGDIAFSGRWQDPRMGGDGAGLEVTLGGIHVKFDDVKVSVKSTFVNWSGAVACLVGGEGITVKIRLKRTTIEKRRSRQTSSSGGSTSSLADVVELPGKVKGKAKRNIRRLSKAGKKGKRLSAKDLDSARASSTNTSYRGNSIGNRIDDCDEDNVSIVTEGSMMSPSLPATSPIHRQYEGNLFGTGPRYPAVATGEYGSEPVTLDRNRVDSGGSILSSLPRQTVKFQQRKSSVGLDYDRGERRIRTHSYMSPTSASSVRSRASGDKVIADKYRYGVSRTKKERWVVKVKCKIPRSCMEVRLSGAFGYFLGLYAKSKLRTAVEKEVELRILHACRVLGILEDTED